jgi:hypothetical protein
MDQTLLYQIKLAADLDRYEDMRSYVNEYLKSLPDSYELDYYKRKFISQAYLNCINKKINTFRLLDSHTILIKQYENYDENTKKSKISENKIESGEESNTKKSGISDENDKRDYKTNLTSYRLKKEKEFHDYVSKIINNELNYYIQKFNINPEDKLYFAKLKADFNKFMLDYLKYENDGDIQKVIDIYNETIKEADNMNIEKHNIIYLNLRLNYYCLCYTNLEKNRKDLLIYKGKINEENEKELKKKKYQEDYEKLIKDTRDAIKEAKKIYDPDDKEKNMILNEESNDYLMIINLLKENLASWSLQFERNSDLSNEDQESENNVGQ